MKEFHFSKLASFSGTIKILQIHTPKFVLLIASTLILVTVVFHHHHNHLTTPLSTLKYGNPNCNIFEGEWIWNPNATYYTNTTCNHIHDHQNCMKFGRTDTDFLKWRWKPNDCELPIFDPFEFLELVRGKALAFVGDSVGRNHMQSLLCLLSKVERPTDVSYREEQEFQRWYYPSYNFTVAVFWTPYLVRTTHAEVNGTTITGLINLYLDEYDLEWTTQIDEFDYIIISAGQWFFRPTMFYENNKLVGCFKCLKDDVKSLELSYGYGKAFQTAFKAINSSPNFKGTTYLRTFSPAHFENGIWNEGANCVRKKPLKSSEITLDYGALWLYNAQVEEFKVAEEEGKRNGKQFRLLNTTHAMFMRPDGHPSSYGHWPQENVTSYNDCVHWCLPGPIDSWSDFLLEMLRRDD
ncbi:hypothetical protein C5167_019681 [Papaver somniferum]|uniref:Uncharacterized protein n=1 Tax=Papaver somniferum TaxID=3469 RepID=A0A4Y7IU38_PAPSO|nr:protein trichome birefringence-like 19 [Papaver somniferum]RZC51251.1 hypothetical protein C5167_019681 [Papaver somniferum]